MPHGGDVATGDAIPAGRPGSGPAAADAPAWAPLRRRAFRWLWLGVLISSIGTWMQEIGAAYRVMGAAFAEVEGRGVAPQAQPALRAAHSREHTRWKIT